MKYITIFNITLVIILLFVILAGTAYYLDDTYHKTSGTTIVFSCIAIVFSITLPACYRK